VTALLQVLGLGRADVVAVAGAGGKTTLVYRLAREARDAGLRVLVTATTHMGTLAEDITGPVILEEDGDADARIEQALRKTGYATVLGQYVRSDKIEGLRGPRVDELAGRADLVVIEADGARGRSLKVPAPHEPVIPRSTTAVVVVAALDVLGRALDDALVHRVELVAAATGRKPGEVVDEPAVASALVHPEGYPARVASGMRAAVFLNKAEDAATWAAAGRIAPRLLGTYERVGAGSARGGEVRAWR
jgi:probable selenium-dependent hydroxylase accessory protein YqeC